MFSPNISELLTSNEAYATDFAKAHLNVEPSRKLAIVTCMDSRMDIFEILGLRNGEAHVIRNAGGVITDDVIRSLCLSQRVLGTEEIVLIHHTDCGLEKVTDDGFKSALETELGVRPQWAVESFTDPYADTRQSIRRLHQTPFVPNQDHISGFVYDVDTRILHQVHLADS